MYCSVYLVLFIHLNAFTKGIIRWKHAYQRILYEHESSENHTDSAEAYFLNSNKKIFIFFFF